MRHTRTFQEFTDFKPEREQGFGKDKPLPNEFFEVIGDYQEGSSWKSRIFLSNQEKIEISKLFKIGLYDDDDYMATIINFSKYILYVYKKEDVDFPGYWLYYAKRFPRNGTMVSNQEPSGYSYKCDGFEGFLQLIYSEIIDPRKYKRD